MQGLNLENVLNMIRGLPSLPETHVRVMELASNPAARITDLTRVINTDVALAARVLQVANTPFYGMNGRIETVARGIVILGVRTIYSLALGAGVMKVLEQDDPRKECGIDIWHHSLQTAVAARELAVHDGTVDFDIVFTGGLLHDMGKLVLAAMFPEAYRNILDEHAASCGHVSDIERRVFGIDHTQTGAVLCDTWKLPHTLKQIVSHHHDKVTSPPEVSIVANANILARLVSPHATGEIHASVEEFRSLLTPLGRLPLLKRLVVSNSLQRPCSGAFAPEGNMGAEFSTGLVRSYFVDNQTQDVPIVVDLECPVLTDAVTLIGLACGCTPVSPADDVCPRLTVTDKPNRCTDNSTLHADDFLTSDNRETWVNIAALHRRLLLSALAVSESDEAMGSLASMEGADCIGRCEHRFTHR